MPLQIERQYGASLDANYSFDTLEELKTYATTSALSYSGQILYCKENDTLYKVNKDKTDTTTLGGGADGKSAYEIWLEKGNTGTEEDFLESLKGEDTDSSFVVTGAIDTDNPDAPVTLDQTFEEIKTAYDNDKTIVADILVAGEAQYIFNLLYVLEDAIAFEWINSAAKTGGQINLMSDNTVSFTMTSFESGGESYDDTEIRELVNGKQDATIFIDATMSTVKDSWDNYLLNVDEEYRYSKVQDMLVDGKTVILRVKVDGVLVELPCVSYESYTDATLTFAAPYYNSSTEEKGSYIAFCASTVGWKLGIKVVKEASSTDMSPFIIKSAYTEGSNGFTIDTSTTTPALWNDWYPAFEAGRPVYWDLHRNSIDSNVDVIRLYPHSHGIYYESTGTKECQFTSIGGYPDYDSKNDSTKYFYIGWFRSGSAPASNYKFVKQYKIGEIPTGGTTGQILVKKSDTDRDVKWADPTTGGLVITGNYTVDDEDNWVVSNIDKTFAEINEAISDNQDVVLKIYPEGDTTNPYILYPAMHYANMGTAFSLMVSDTGQISGLSVMITADNQVIASRNEYNFTEFCNKTELDERLGGKEVKIINNQFGDVTKLFRITDAPTESGKGYTVKLVAQRKNATIHSEYLSVSRVSDTYTYDSNIELQERNGSTGESTTMENSNFLIVDANHEVWAHIPSYTYAYVELISPNVKGTFVIDGSEGEFAEDAVLDTFSKRETDAFAKKGDLEELKKSVSDGKTLVAGAITGKGIETATNDTFEAMAENVRKIPSAPCGTVWEETDYVVGAGYDVVEVIYGNKVFVTSNSNRLHYSEDGIHWHLGLDRSSENANNESIVFSYYEDKKMWVAYDYKSSYDKPRHIYYSLDGKTWGQATSSALYFDNFAYHNGKFAVWHSQANCTSGQIYYSVDGKTWETTTYFPSSEKISFIIQYANGFWYVSITTVGGTKSLYRTIDFKGFSLVSGYQLMVNSSIYYIEGVYFARLITTNGTTQYSYSTNGIDWSAMTMNFTGQMMYGIHFLNCVTFKGRYIASTYAGIISGTLGSTWTQPSNMISTSYTLYRIKDRLFAYTLSGPAMSNPGIFYTDDGINWTKGEGSPTHHLGSKSIIHECNGKLYINSAYSGSNITYPVYMSEDNGVSWNAITEGNNILGYYDGIYLSKQYKYSFDLETWQDTNITDSTVNSISYFDYGNGILVGASQDGIKCTYFSPFVKREE